MGRKVFVFIITFALINLSFGNKIKCFWMYFHCFNRLGCDFRGEPKPGSQDLCISEPIKAQSLPIKYRGFTYCEGYVDFTQCGFNKKRLDDYSYQKIQVDESSSGRLDYCRNLMKS